MLRHLCLFILAFQFWSADALLCPLASSVTRRKASPLFAESQCALSQKVLDRSKRWVVIVDDEESVRSAVGDYLYDRGFKVTACADAFALVEVVTKPPSEGQLPVVPDAIVSDIRMPGGKDGLDLLSLIRSSDRLKKVPVILLTAKSLTTDRIAGYEAGADVYLTKPFNPEELLSIVDNTILRREQMTGKGGQLADLQAEMLDIKQILKNNASNKVKSTNIYLTPSEREVLELVCKGYSNAEVAKERGVTTTYTGNVIQNLFLKTLTRNRTELMKWALQTGYVSPRQLS